MAVQLSSVAAVSPFATRAARVLVCAIDDGLFGVHLDWVEAVYPRAALSVHSVRIKGVRPRPFVLHRQEPATIIDLREALDLEGVLGATTRAELLIVRSGSLLLALPVDTCVGVRDIDLRSQVPVPTTLVRDGAMPVGHIVDLDQKMLVVLDPNRLVDGSAREALMLVQRKALRFREREIKLDEVWKTLVQQPSPAQLRVYARLCSRNGRSKMAAAARTVLKCWEDGHAAADNGCGEIAGALPAIIHATRAARTGVLHAQAAGENESGQFHYLAGNVVDATFAGEHGRAAVKRLLAHPAVTTRFAEGEPDHTVERMNDSTVALALWALNALANERRPRRGR